MKFRQKVRSRGRPRRAVKQLLFNKTKIDVSTRVLTKKRKITSSVLDQASDERVQKRRKLPTTSPPPFRRSRRRKAK